MNKAGTQGIVSSKTGPIYSPCVVVSLNALRQTNSGSKVVSLIEPLDAPRRYNGAPGQQHLVIREHPKTGERTLDRLSWGLIPNWWEGDCGRKPINAKAETAASLPSFRDAYKRRRCLVPIDNFFVSGAPLTP